MGSWPLNGYWLLRFHNHNKYKPCLHIDITLMFFQVDKPAKVGYKKTALITQDGFHIPPDVNSLLRRPEGVVNAAWMV